MARTPRSATTSLVQRLDRVADPSSLDALDGPRARLGVDVPAAWLDEGAELAITAPPRLACARCDGGGCDGCARSGALRAPEAIEARVVTAFIPAIARGDRGGVALRIPAPFGPDHPIVLLVIELRSATVASSHVRRVASLPRAAEGPSAPPLPALTISPYAIAVLLAGIAAIVASVIGR